MKLSGNHSSLIDTAQKLLRFLDLRTDNLKASPGIIISKRSAGARNHKIKIKTVQSGLDLTVTQNATIQKLRIFTNQPELLITYITDFADSENIQISS